MPIILIIGIILIRRKTNNWREKRNNCKKFRKQLASKLNESKWNRLPISNYSNKIRWIKIRLLIRLIISRKLVKNWISINNY